jgi:hypothetical protein
MALLVACALLLPSFGAPPTQGLGARLDALSSASAAERLRAERWLATHVRPADLPALEAAIRGGDAEVRRRLAAAVGSEDRSFALAVELARSAEAEVAAVGREALGEHAARFLPDLDEPPLAGAALQRALRLSARSGSTRLLTVDLAETAAELLALLARSGELSVALVMDPGQYAAAQVRAAPEELAYIASWDGLATAIAATHGMRLAGVGFDADGELKGGAFLAFQAAGPGGPASGRELLLDWAAPSERRPATPAELHALLATGWPAARIWIEELAEAGDGAAWEALLRAARAGSWPFSWQERSDAEALLARLAEAARAGLSQAAAEAALALAAAPSQLGDGTSLGALLAGALDAAAGDEERRLLLVAAEGSASASPELERRLRALLGEGAASASAPLLRQALRALAAVAQPGSAELVLGDPARLFGAREGFRAAEYRELAALLQASGARPPAGLAAPGALLALGFPEALVEARLGWLAWLSAAGERDAAARIVLETPRGVQVFGDSLARDVRRGDLAELAALLLRAAELAGSDEERERVEHLQIWTGVADAELLAAYRARAAELPRRDAGLLGALAGDPDPAADAARDALCDGLAQALRDDVSLEAALAYTEPLERAIGDLLRRGADQAASDLAEAARRRLRGEPGGAARAQLSAAGWPPLPPALDPLDLRLARRP